MDPSVSSHPSPHCQLQTFHLLKSGWVGSFKWQSRGARDGAAAWWGGVLLVGSKKTHPLNPEEWIQESCLQGTAQIPYLRVIVWKESIQIR